MLLLSDVVGRTVYGPGRSPVGRLADVAVSTDAHRAGPFVSRLLVRTKRTPDLLVPWSAVARLEHCVVELRSDVAEFAITSIDEALATDEILLVRDILDTQIIDIAGQRLARVADVVLSTHPGQQAEVIGVDVGFGAVLRRLGLPRCGRSDVVAWTDLHPTSERGHAVQLSTPRSAVHTLDARGLAALIARLDTDTAVEVLTAKGPELAACVIAESHPVVGERVLRAMPETQTTSVVAGMPAPHAARWRTRLATPRRLGGRNFLRFRVWPRRRHAPARVRA